MKWQGRNETTNGLLRPYVPRRLDFRTLTQAELEAISDQLNGRPRHTRAFKTITRVGRGAALTALAPGDPSACVNRVDPPMGVARVSWL
jgi:hypothetical protein